MPETYKSFGTILGTTAATSIYSGVTGTAIVNSVYFSNVSSANSAKVSLEVLKGSTAYSIITNGVVPIESSFQAIDAPIILETSDTLRATAGLTGIFHVFVSVLEVT
jgi:hypothetical protein